MKRDLEKEELSGVLDTDLTPRDVFQREYDGMEYLAGYFVMHNANQIFGHDGWGYKVLDTERVENGKGGVFISKVRVWAELDGVKLQPKTDVGTGEIKETKKGIQMIDMAVKASVTDGVKRALRSYGKQFGLGLYDNADILPVIQRELSESETEEIVPVVSRINKIENEDDLKEMVKIVSDTVKDRNKQQNLYLKQVLKKVEMELVEEANESKDKKKD